MNSQIFKWIIGILAAWALLVTPNVLMPLFMHRPGSAWSIVLASGYLLLPTAVVLFWRGNRQGYPICIMGAVLVFSFGVTRSIFYGLSLAILHLFVLGLVILDRTIMPSSTPPPRSLGVRNQ